VSLFIDGLLFVDPAQLDAARTAVLFASLAGIAGFTLLKRALASRVPPSKG
jgi:Na+/H+ antiporter NhaA